MDPRVDSFVERYWDQFLAQHPLFATMVGDDRFDDRLPVLDDAGLAARERVHSAALAECDSLGRDGLDPESRTALDMAESIARRELDFVRWRFDRFWSVSHMIGGHLFGPPNLLGEIAMLQRIDTAEGLDRYLARLERLPRYLQIAAATAADAASSGQTVPRLVVDRSIDLVEGLLDTAVSGSPIVEAVPDPAGKQRAAAALSDVVYPAYARYLEALREHRAAARTTIGLSALPDGEEMYAAEIRGWTTLSLDAREIHELGVTELAAVEDERREIASRLGFDDAAEAVATLTSAGRNTRGRDDLLALVRDQVQRAWDAAPAFFGRLPEHNCEVHAVPAYQEEHLLDFYQGPTAGGERPGIFYVNTKPRPAHSMATTSYHESNPGHHFQIALNTSAPRRPPMRLFSAELTGAAFAEGWGLYSERLADEMGLYADDYERLGMLELQALRAARLVVDTGIHALGWDRDRAVTQLETTGLPAWKAATEVDRYIAMPAQALCYRLGQLQIERWRAAAAEERGAAFSLPAFHDRLLSLGSLPLPAMERELLSTVAASS